ncbi:hypothetical protein QBC39DRAFT_407847 [Podospora conica]|nr:hypothetical protein QBC39DRAFT_407847 [Schizothecium conicum]
MAVPTLYLNIPTSNPDASLKFFTALGFDPAPEFSDADTKAFRLPAPNSTVCAMIHSHKRFKGFMRPGTEVSDATKTTEVLISLAAEKKEEVDAWIAKAVAAGGSADPFTMPGYGAECGMYSRSFADLDGHIWEVVAMVGALREKARAAREAKSGMGTWRRYKLGQAQFTAWLRGAAAKVTSKLGAADEDSQANKTTRQKKKERQKAEAARASTDEPTMIRLKELEIMTQTVIDGADDVPEAPISILRDVVALRKRSARFFQAAALRAKDARLAQSNATHSHMITILDRMLAKFELRSSKSQKPTEPESASVSVSDLNNMFSHLEVFGHHADAGDDDHDNDDAESFLTQSTSGRRKPSKKKKAKPAPQTRTSTADQDWEPDLFDVDADVDEDPFDIYMLIYCLFEDFNLIREHVVEKWCDYFYNDTDIRIETLAVITNAACEMFQKLEEDYVRHAAKIDKKMVDYWWIVHNLVILENNGEWTQAVEGDDTAYLISYNDIDFDTNGEPDYNTYRRHDVVMGPQADRLALPAHSILSAGLEWAPEGQTLLNSQIDKYTHLFGTTKQKDRFAMFLEMIKELFGEVGLIKFLKEGEDLDFLLPAEPEFLLSLQDSLRRIPGIAESVSTIFSLQLWLDIRETVELRASDAFFDMRYAARHVKANLTRYLPYTTGPRKSLERTFTRRLAELDRFMLHDVTYYQKDLRWADQDPTQKIEPFFLLRREPVWAGLLAFRAQLIASRLGQSLTSSSFLVDAVAYLYSAARRAHPSTTAAWPAMDAWIRAIYHPASAFHANLAPEKSPTDILLAFPQHAPVFFGAREGGGSFALPPYHPSVHRACMAKPFTNATVLREALYNRYADNRRDCYAHLMYLEQLVLYRLQPGIDMAGEEWKGVIGGGDIRGGMATAMQAKVGGGDRRVRNKEGGVPEGWSRRGEGPEMFAGEGAGEGMGGEGGRRLRREMDLARLSPVEMLEVLEGGVEEVMGEGVMAVDYFEVWEGSLRVLKGLWADEGVRGVIGGWEGTWKEGDEVDGLMGVMVGIVDAVGRGDGDVTVGKVAGVVGKVVAELEKEREEREQRDIEGDGDDDDDDGYPGTEPPNVALFLRKQKRWSMGWRETDFTVSTYGRAGYGHLVRDRAYMMKLLADM